MAAVAVIGAGVAGLTAAYRLKRMGYRVVVYEASERAGGVIRTERRDGYLAELGPNSIATAGPAAMELFAQLGLESSRIEAQREAKKRYIVRKGKLVALPTSPSQLLTTRLLSNADGQVVADGADALRRLVGQVASPVRWDLCMATMAELGVTGLLELPPAGTLTGIAKRNLKGVELFALNTPDQLPDAAAFIASHGGAR